MVADAVPPVCKIMDYGKYVFDAKKQQAAARKKQKQTQVKEMKFRPGTEDGDYQVKLRNLVRFLEQGIKPKLRCDFVVVKWLTKKLVCSLLKRVEADLAELGTVEQFPKMEGRQMTMVIGPKKKK